MCGIVGLINLNNVPIEDPTVITRMANHLVHRGPDDEGFLKDGPLAFGFRRLSIIDLESGHQPVANETNAVWAMLNGEIYNFVELRAELESLGHQFRTKSDTEVIVHAYESFGLDFLEKLRGMFAIALWDSQKRRPFDCAGSTGKEAAYLERRYHGQLALRPKSKLCFLGPV